MLLRSIEGDLKSIYIYAYIYIYIYIKVDKYINPFVIGCKAGWKVCSRVAWRTSLEDYQIGWFCFDGGRAG